MSEPDSIAAYAQNTSIVAEAQALLTQQFQGKTRIAQLLTALTTQTQDLENAAWAVLSVTLENAVGYQLDQYGALLNFGRVGMTDDQYRAVLSGMVLARRSQGTAPQLQAIVTAMIGTSFAYREGCASVTVEPVYPVALDPSLVRLVLLLAKAAGVQLAVFDPPDDESALFTLTDGDLLPVEDVDEGWGDATDNTVGGELTGVL